LIGRHRQLLWVTTAIAALALARPSPCRADPRYDYILHCRGCHGPNGEGLPGGVPDFRGHLGKFLSVPGGREYLIRVPGTSQSELSDEQVAGVLNWLVREFSPAQVPADFEPFTTAEVSQHRRPPLVDVARVRTELLQAIQAREASTRHAGVRR
jgi:hypothetical protein